MSKFDLLNVFVGNSQDYLFKGRQILNECQIQLVVPGMNGLDLSFSIKQNMDGPLCMEPNKMGLTCMESSLNDDNHKCTTNPAIGLGPIIRVPCLQNQ